MVQNSKSKSEEIESLRKELELSRANFHSFLDNINQATAIFKATDDGNDFVFTFFNSFAESLEKVSRKDLLGKTITESFPNVEEFGLLSIFQDVWKTGKAKIHPTKFYEDDRITRWLENYVFKLPDGQIVVVYKDISGVDFPESNPNPVIRVSYKGEILYSNPASKEILSKWNFKKGKLNDKKILSIIKEISSSNQSMIIEYELDGKTILLTFSPISNFDYINIYGLDISKQSNSEKKLKKSLKEIILLSKFPEENPNPVMRITTDGKVVFQNKSSIKILEIWEFSDGYIHSENILIFLKTLKTVPRKLIFDVKVYDILYSVSIVPIKDTQFLNVYALDITERTEATQELIQSKNKYFNLFTNLLDGFAYCKIIKDSNGIPNDFKYIDINPSFTRLIGLSRQMCIGKLVTELFPTIRDEPTDWFEIYGEVALSGKEKYIESYFEALQKHFSIFIYRPEPDHFVTVFRDITERIKTNEELERRVKVRTQDLNDVLAQEILYKEQLLISSQFKSEFMASMSHELRTPLNSIIGFTDVILERISGEINERQEKYLNNVKTSAMHLLELINDVLDIAKIEAGKMDLQYEDFNLSDILKKVDAMIQPLYKNKNLKFEITKIDKKKVIRIDSRRFMEILYNLLSNAIKYTKKGEVKLKILERKDEWEFNIIDSGIGIANEDFPLIFKEFKRIQSDYSSPQEGTGLGLPLTKKFIEIHGGSLSFTSELGKGSTFTFTIPKSENSKTS
jgi:signal transduction histidine kinase